MRHTAIEYNSKINKVLKITIYFASRLIGLAMDAYDGHRLAQGNVTRWKTIVSISLFP